MRPLIATLLILISLAFCSTMTQNHKQKASDNFCEVIRATRQLTKLKFAPYDHDKINLKGLNQLDSENHSLLYGEEQTSSEKNYLYGQFKISKTRLGLVCFNKTVECDHDMFFFSLHIIDSCTKANDLITLSLSTDDGGILYDVSSSLNKTLDTLTIKRETTSEWVVGTDSKIDTLFTDIYKVDLKSKHLDTVAKKSFFKKLKHD